ncbi:hypothetical protein DS964_27350, partial [Escherichia coli]
QVYRRCRNGRPDKAFTPHPAIGTPCLMRCWRVLSGPAIRIYLFCQSSGWQVMRTQEQKEENTGKRQMQI